MGTFLEELSKGKKFRLPKRYFVGIVKEFLSAGGQLPKGWKIVECKEIAGEQTEKSLREFTAFERMGERLANALGSKLETTARYTLYPHEIEEAIMRYLVAENGADYDKLCQADFTINIQGRTVDKNELVTVESDFKCARVTVDVEV